MNATDEARVREIEDCVRLDGFAAAGTYVPELIAMLRRDDDEREPIRKPKSRRQDGATS